MKIHKRRVKGMRHLASVDVIEVDETKKFFTANQKNVLIMRNGVRFEIIELFLLFPFLCVIVIR